jgi:hypothetical protein
MSRACIFSFCIAAGLTVASAAHAASGTVTGQTSQGTDTAAKVEKTAASATATVAPTASVEVPVASDQELQVVRQRGAEAKADARAKAEAKLSAAARQLEKEVAVKGEADVAARLANELGLATEALTAERRTLGVSWSEVVIAHTLQANSEVGVTVQQVLGLRAEGLGWGQIAAGLGFDLGHAVRAVQSEVKVAVGRAKVDGQVAVIRGSKLDTGSSVKAGTGTSAVPSAGVGASVGTPLPSVKPGL